MLLIIALRKASEPFTELVAARQTEPAALKVEEVAAKLRIGYSLGVTRAVRGLMAMAGL